MGFAVPSLLGRLGQGFCVGGGEREAAVAAGPEGSTEPSRGGATASRVQEHLGRGKPGKRRK